MEIIIVVGPICSGKSTYSNRYPSNFVKLDIGNVVREITSTQIRVQDEHLDVLIINKVVEKIASTVDLMKEKPIRGMVISGIRQLSILNVIEKLSADMDYKITYIYLYVPTAILKYRYHRSARVKDNSKTFEEAMMGDYKIGLEELTKELLINRRTQTLHNFTSYETNSVQKISQW